MFDEPSRIARIAASFTEKVLQRCQRANPVRPLDHHPPEYGREMYPDKGGATQEQQAAQHSIKSESEMEQEDGVGGYAVDHSALGIF